MFPKKRDFTAALVKKFPAIKTVTYSVNRSPEFLTLGDHAETLYGDGYIIDEICGKRFRISPQSFYQVNPQQAERLYSYAVDAAALKESDTLLDAYSGTGTIGIIASDRVKSVQGIEYNSAAVRDAVQNCKLNGLTRDIAFNRGDAGEYLPGARQEGSSLRRGDNGPGTRRGRQAIPPGAFRHQTGASCLHFMQSGHAGEGSQVAFEVLRHRRDSAIRYVPVHAAC